jgi:hypothetical protein
MKFKIIILSNEKGWRTYTILTLLKFNKNESQQENVARFPRIRETG